jgi:hypothetical protein
VFTLDGECDEVVQNCARDQFILEALLTALVAPVTADCVQEHENNSRGKQLQPACKYGIKSNKIIKSNFVFVQWVCWG